MKLTIYDRFDFPHPFALTKSNTRGSLDQFYYNLYAIGSVPKSNVLCHVFWPPYVPLCVFTWTTHRYSRMYSLYQSKGVVSNDLVPMSFVFGSKTHDDESIILYDKLLFVGVQAATAKENLLPTDVERIVRPLLSCLSVEWNYINPPACR